MGFNPLSPFGHAASAAAHGLGSAARDKLEAAADAAGHLASGVGHAAAHGLSTVGHAAGAVAHSATQAASTAGRTIGSAAAAGARSIDQATTGARVAIGYAAGATAREAVEWGRSAGTVAGEVAGALTNNHRTGDDPTARAAQADALLAADVYEAQAHLDRLPPDTRPATTAELERLGLTGLMDTRNFRARLYVTGSGADTHYTVAFRGTRMESAADWKTNAGQALGQQTEHYQAALKIGRALAEHPELSISMTGHSMGGGLASAAAIAAGRDANSFNAAGLSANTIRVAQAINAAGDTHRAARVEAFFVRGEVLSALQDGGDRFAAGLLGGLIGGPTGRAVAAALVDAPEAYGHRHAIGNDRPPGHGWSEELPAYRAIARHGMDYVLHNLAN